MPYEFKLPDLGEGISEVELRRWLVKEGDQVKEHQPIVEVETDKALVEVPSPAAGEVLRLHHQEGETVPVGEVLITIKRSGEWVAAQEQPQEEAPRRPKSVGIVGELPEAEDEPEVLATPAVRKLARERGIDLSRVRGSGPRGSVTLEDLEQQGAAPTAAAPAAPAAAPAAPPAEEVTAERQQLRGVRRAIARNVLASKMTTASVTTTEEVDITELSQLRDREQKTLEARGRHLTFLPFFMKAAQHALREHPYLNASIDDASGTIVLKKHYHFGIAVDTEQGLMVPVIRDVDKKSIFDLAGELQELGKKARERTIGIEEMKGSSFTITNYGHFGGGFSTPIINWPDVAILGFGRIAERPWVYQGQIAVRKILPLSLTFDHRATDGVDASRFLMKVLQYLEDPGLFLIDSI